MNKGVKILYVSKHVIYTDEYVYEVIPRDRTGKTSLYNFLRNEKFSWEQTDE